MSIFAARVVLCSLLALASQPARADEPSALAAQPKGWTDILPGARLAGWTRFPIKSELRPEIPVWQVDAKARVLRCRGDLPRAETPGGKDGSRELLRFDRELGDFVLHVEWRFVDPRRPGWNSGVFARISADRSVWHQAQLGGGAGGFWFGDVPDETGKIARRKLTATEARVAPAGQWNTYEITAVGDELRLWVNGAVVSVWKGITVARGHIGLEAENHDVEFRNLKLKELGGRARR